MNIVETIAVVGGAIVTAWLLSALIITSRDLKKENVNV